MFHADDPDTSAAAARRAMRGRKRDTIQDAIVSIVAVSPATPREILDIYKRARASAGWPVADLQDIRRRMTEVTQAGRVVDTKVRRNGERVMGVAA